jgi:hypothetical protein
VNDLTPSLSAAVWASFHQKPSHYLSLITPLFSAKPNARMVLGSARQGQTCVGATCCPCSHLRAVHDSAHPRGERLKPPNNRMGALLQKRRDTHARQPSRANFVHTDPRSSSRRRDCVETACDMALAMAPQHRMPASPAGVVDESREIKLPPRADELADLRVRSPSQQRKFHAAGPSAAFSAEERLRRCNAYVYVQSWGAIALRQRLAK